MSLQKVTSPKGQDQNFDSGSCVQVFFSLIPPYWNWDTDASVASCHSKIQVYKQTCSQLQKRIILWPLEQVQGVVSCWDIL